MRKQLLFLALVFERHERQSVRITPAILMLITAEEMRRI